MDISPELMRQQYRYWTLWCRRFGFRSYKNVYAVWLCREKNECQQQSHRVYGALGNGEHFQGFLVRSQVRKHAFAALSDSFACGFKQRHEGGHWVVVEATSPEHSLEHEDVVAVREMLMANEDHSVFCGVYFISNGHGAVKIGQTASNIGLRLSQLQAASAYPLRVCALIDTTSQRKLEHKLHREYKHLLMRGEWFSLTEPEAIEIAIRNGGRAASKKVRSFNSIPKCRS